MQYVVFDMEWNQPLGPSLRVREPVLLKGDIIEIGAVRLDEDFNILDTFRAYINPVYYKKMHRRVGNLTHIDPELLSSAPEFPEVYERFREWCGDDFRFITWSPNDVPMLINNLEVRGMSGEDLPEAIDAQSIFADQILRDDSCCSLSHALELMAMPIDTAHDALNDAVNTVRICECLDMEQGIRDWDDWCAWRAEQEAEEAASMA